MRPVCGLVTNDVACGLTLQVVDVACTHHILGHVSERDRPLLDALVPLVEHCPDWLAVQNPVLKSGIKELVRVLVGLEVQTHVTAFLRDQVEHRTFGQGGLRTLYRARANDLARLVVSQLL